MNYTELTAAIIAWTNNYSTEFAASTDTIIRLAETRLVREADIREYRKHATALTTSNDPYLTVPSNILQIRYLRIRAADFIEPRPESFMSEYNQIVTTAGTPKYYGHWDSETLVLAPAPNSALTVELSYKQKPSSIVTESTTWMGTNAEDTLFYACLVEAGLMLQLMPELQAPLDARYKESVAALQAQEQINSSDEYMTRSTV